MIYHRMTLGALIDELEDLDRLGDPLVQGLDGTVRSYRGYYERNATTPCNSALAASVLVELYRSQIGLPITGYKGGDYTVDPDQLIYYADYGDTGPCILGLERGADGVYRPVLLAEDWHM